MKQSICILFSLIIICLFTACGGDEDLTITSNDSNVDESIDNTENTEIRNSESITSDTNIVNSDESETTIKFGEEDNGEITTVSDEELYKQYYAPTVYIQDVCCSTGETVKVKALLINNPGILGMSGSISFDEKVMTLEKIEEGEVFDNILNFTCSKELTNGCHMLWDGIEINDEQVKDGVLINMEFKIKSDTKAGRYPITLVLDNDGTVDNDLIPLDIIVECGYVTVK